MYLHDNQLEFCRLFSGLPGCFMDVCSTSPELAQIPVFWEKWSLTLIKSYHSSWLCMWQVPVYICYRIKWLKWPSGSLVMFSEWDIFNDTFIYVSFILTPLRFNLVIWKPIQDHSGTSFQSFNCGRAFHSVLEALNTSFVPKTSVTTSIQNFTLRHMNKADVSSRIQLSSVTISVLKNTKYSIYGWPNSCLLSGIKKLKGKQRFSVC